MDATIFKSLGLGLVASNKSLRGKDGGFSKTIEVFPPETLSMHDGEIVSNPTLVEHKTTDIDGNVNQGGIITDMTIEATWLPQGSNRLTAPDVRRGERVELFTTGDSGKFYWRPMGLDDNLRKKETIIIGISNTTDEGDTELKPENMYWVEFSTHSKRLAFSSSKSDGEPFQYEFFFDMAQGEVVLTDDIGNFFNLVSKQNLLHMQNSKGTSFKLDQKDIKFDAPQDVVGNVFRDVSVSAGRDVVIQARRDATVKGGRKAMLSGGGSEMTLEAGQTTLKTPKFVGRRT